MKKLKRLLIMYQGYIDMIKQFFCVLLLSCAIGNSVAVEPEKGKIYEEGKDYYRLSSEITSHKVIQELIAKNPEKVVVIEFFNYGCFGCMRLHPFLDKWVETKPKNVIFYRYPLMFNKKWEVLAKAYYVNKMLEVSNFSDQDFFNTIYQHRVDLSDEEKLSDFFIERGVSGKKFDDLYNSFAVNQEITKAKEVANAYQVLVSPTVIVNKPYGSYVITPTLVKGNNQDLISIMGYLIAS